MKSVIMEICAEYHARLEDFPKEMPTDFATHKLYVALGDLERELITVNEFLFLCKLYGYFLNNYRYPTAEEGAKRNFADVEGERMKKAMVCIIRTPDDEEGGTPNDTGAD